MAIFIDCDQRLGTWRYIADAGHYTPYNGRAQHGDVILRWGCNHGGHTYPEGVKVLNKRIILDKKDQGILMRDANVSIPKIFDSRLHWERAGTPRILEKPRVGQMGTGIKLVTRPRWAGDCIYQLYIEKTREFRAMMVGELMAFFMEKHAPTNGDIRWNEHRGSEWTRVPEDRELRRKVKRLGYEALKAIGYDFGACDIIMDRTGRPYVLEVNSRPEFEERNAERFAHAIASYIGR